MQGTSADVLSFSGLGRTSIHASRAHSEHIQRTQIVQIALSARRCTALHLRLYSAQIEQQDHLPPTPLPAKHDTKACSSSQAANLFNYFSSFSLHTISGKQDAEAIMRTPQVLNPTWENSFDNICYKKTPKSI